MGTLKEEYEKAERESYKKEFENAIQTYGGQRLLEEYEKLKKEREKYDVHISGPTAKGEMKMQKMTTKPSLKELKKIIEELGKSLKK